MDYARTILGLPVPRVLAWNARADATTNSVGAEYILMEKAEGVELHHRWDTFHGRQVAPMIEQALRFENVFATRKFSQIGSLYYKEDVEEALQARPLYAADGGNETPNGAEDKFRMGPLVDWDVWRGTRSCLNVSRGPCKWLIINCNVAMSHQIVVNRDRCGLVYSRHHSNRARMATTIC